MAREGLQMLQSMTKERLYQIASIVCIGSFFFIMMLVSCLKTPLAKGEADDYALETVAIQMTGNTEITKEVIGQAKKDFPDFADRFEESWNGVHAGTTDLYLAYNGKVYPWYGAAYSCICIPIKILLRILHLNQTYTFVLTNVCLYTFALLYVFFNLRSSRKNIFLLILLLVCSPAVAYCSWPSAEIFTFSFVVLSLTDFVNKNYRRAAFYVSVAGSMNTTVMILGVFIIADYFMHLLRGTGGIREAVLKVIKNTKSILLFAACFLPSLSTYTYNLIFMHELELQTSLGLAKTDGWFGRILAYLFDLNMGYIAYYLIAFLLWLILLIWSRKRKRNAGMLYMLSAAFLGVICAYSLHFHINCGMEGIARYSAWTAPIFLFAIVTQYEEVFFNQTVRRFFCAATVIGAVSTASVLLWFYSCNHLSHLQYSPLAAKVLENYPFLYHPYPYTFIARTQHIDGGYWGNEDKSAFYYEDTDGYIRKILASDETKSYLSEHLAGTPEDVAIVRERLEEAKYFEYVNLEKKIEVFVDKDYPDAFYPAEDDTLLGKSKGIYEREGDKHWFSNDAAIVLNGEKIRDIGIEIEYYVMREMIDKYSGETLTGEIYCNKELVGTMDLSKEGHHVITIEPDKLPECETGYYRIRIKSRYYLQPSLDAEGGSDVRKLCILVPYIGPVIGHAERNNE